MKCELCGTKPCGWEIDPNKTVVEWRKYPNEKPPFGLKVLCWGSVVNLGCLFEETEDLEGGWFTVDEEDQFYGITHWTYMPSGPVKTYERNEDGNYPELEPVIKS